MNYEYALSPLQLVIIVYLGHIVDLPPSIANVCPVMKEASSDAKKAIVLAKRTRNDE